jgi:hypothetical protein
MEVFASILYTQRFRRPYWFLGMPRQELELVGLSLSTDSANLSLFNSDHRLTSSDQYSDPGIFTLIPPSGYPLWERYPEIVDRVARFLGLGDEVAELIVVTNGDPHQEAFVAKILAETRRALFVGYRSTEQLLDDAAMLLPDCCYGPGSRFTKYIKRKNGDPYTMDDRRLMFASHLDFPFADSMIHLRDRSEHVRNVYRAIPSIVQEEIAFLEEAQKDGFESLENYDL